MTAPPPATCDRCRWLVVSADQAECAWSNNAIISRAWQPGQPRPLWCPKQMEPVQ
jgi:hypothetical protein